MGEVVAKPGLTQDAPAPQLVDCMHDGVSVEVAGLADQLQAEVAPHGSARPATCCAASEALSSRRCRTSLTSSAATAAPAAPGDTLRSASTTYSGYPPVADCRRDRSSLGSGRPSICRAASAVSDDEKGLSARSVTRPDEPNDRIADTTSVLSASSSSRAVATISSWELFVSPSRNTTQSIVSLSHHWRSSRTSIVGRSATRTARARPSKKRSRCHASTLAGAASDDATAGEPRGTSRSTSARHTGSSASSAARSCGERSQSATGANAMRPDAPKHRAVATIAACRATTRENSVTSRVLPTPASPVTRTSPGRPSCASPHRTISLSSSGWRPIRLGLTTKPRPAPGRPSRRTPNWALSSPMTRSMVSTVAGEGLTPSSCSSTEAHR